jgi:hypothetical protein
VNCDGALSVAVDITVTASLTLTLTNLQVGIPVQIVFTAGAASVTLKVAMSTPGGVTYTALCKPAAGGAGALSVNLTSTGLLISASGNTWIMSGTTEYRSSTPNWLVAAAI